MAKIRISYFVLVISVLLGIIAFSSLGCARSSADLTVMSSTAFDHSHEVTIKGAEMDSPADRTYTTTSAGAVPHTHTLTLTKADFEEIKKSNAVTVTSSPFPADNHTHTFRIKMGM